MHIDRWSDSMLHVSARRKTANASPWRRGCSVLCRRKKRSPGINSRSCYLTSRWRIRWLTWQHRLHAAGERVPWPARERRLRDNPRRGVVASTETSSNETMVMKISASEAGVPLLGAVGPRYVVKQATVKRCVLALLLVSVASIFYYTHYIISSGPLSR